MRELRQAIAALATKEQVVFALGLTEEQPDEWWETQFRTVKGRFLSYLLFKHRMDMTLVAEDTETYDEQVAYDMLFSAEEMLNTEAPNLYAAIRHWWKSVGTYLHNRAFDAKREKQKIDSLYIAVLVFFPTGRPLYLAYERGAVVLNTDNPFQFPVKSISDISKSNLQEAAKDFDGILKDVGATHVKLLPKQRQ